MPGALNEVFGQEDPSNEDILSFGQGPLSMNAMQTNPLIGGLDRLRQQARSIPDTTQIDMFRRINSPEDPEEKMLRERGVAMMHTPEEIRAARAETGRERTRSLASLDNLPIDDRIPWLKFAGAIGRPGNFGEALGHGLTAFADAKSGEQSARIAAARQKAGLMGSYAGQSEAGLLAEDKLGLSMVHNSAALKRARQLIESRSNVKTSPAYIAAASKVASAGIDPQSSQGQQAIKLELDRGAFLGGLKPDLKSHASILMQSNPEMSLQDLSKALGLRQKALDDIAAKAAQDKINPLAHFGIDPDANPDLTGEDYLSALPKTLQEIVKSVASGKTPLSALSNKGGYREAILGAVSRYDPEFATTRSGVRRDFASGPDSKNIIAINTAMGHMGTLSELGEALKNKDTRLLNTITNKVLQGLGAPEQTSFDVGLAAVASEMAKVFRQTGMSVQDIDEWRHAFSKSNSPAQMGKGIKDATKLLRSRVDALNHKWNINLNETGGYPNMFMPEAKEAYEKLSKFGESSKGEVEGWINRAMEKNKGMTREQVIEEGKKIKKIPENFGG